MLHLNALNKENREIVKAYDWNRIARELYPQEPCKNAPNQISHYLECYHHVKRKNVTISLVKRFLDRFSSPHILDVGCGEGYYTSSLVTKNSFVVGVDIAINCLRRAKRNVEGADFVLCDANAMPFKGEAFDLVIAAQFLEHVTDPIFTVSTLRSLMKNNGFIFYEIPSKSNLTDILLRKLLRREPVWGLKIDLSHKHFFSKEKLTQVFKECQLKLIKVYGVVHFRYHFPLISRLVCDWKRKFWHQLNVLDNLFGIINNEWGSIQIYLLVKN